MLDYRLQKLYKELEELEAKEAWTDLVRVYKEAIQISLEVYGEYHEETLALYTEYGGLLRNLGFYKESLVILHKAIQVAEQLKGTSHPDYASSLVNLANLLRMMKQYDESEILFLKAKSIYENTIGDQAFVYAGLCNNLGLLYQAMHRYEDAVPLHKISLTILRKDPSHEVLYGITLNNLVEPFKHLGQRNQAISVLKTAIGIFQKYIDHASVLYAAAVNNLGSIYYEDGEYEKAKECFETALKISEEKLGTKSESYQNSLNNYKLTEDKIKRTSYKETERNPSDREYTTNIVCSTNGGITEESKGLELAKAYFFNICYPMLERELKEYLPRMAAGLIGEGSECYGYDDMISRDHDFGPSFQIYIPAEDIPIYGAKLRAEIDKLPTNYAGFGERNTSTYGGGRIGLFSIEDFYDKYLSIHEVPTSNDIWLQMKDYPLSTATNGEVFMDNLGTFTKIREGLLKHYPKDVQRKKMAAECMQIAQSGQYNLPRSLKRGQYVAAYHALNEFIEHYSSMIYLLNKVYKPYYKWEHEGLKALPILGKTSHTALSHIVSLSLQTQGNQIVFEVEQLCVKLVQVLRGKKLSTAPGDFLLDHGPELLKGIEDPKLRHSNPWK